MNFDSFSHGQIKSKIWLCEELEKHTKLGASVTILGSWYNVLAFMMLTRKPVGYTKIVGVDIDNQAIEISNKICDAWTLGPDRIVTNIVDSANTHMPFTDIVINCSAEHFENTNWFKLIPSKTLVCIQSSNMLEQGEPWFIKQPSPTQESFLEKYKFSEVLFKGTLRIQYETWGYDRYMVIGIK